MPTDPGPGAEVAAAGGVLWRPSRRHGVRIAVVHRPRYDDWSLPKGKLDRGETLPVAGSREIREETGHAAVLGALLAVVRYPVTSGTKRVHYYSARAAGGDFTPNAEVDRLEWLAPAAARRLLTYEIDRRVLAGFLALPTDLRTVVLVRHARAGHREQFPGPDEARTLDGKGQRQAIALADELLPFAPVTIAAAPAVRCVATVTPLAEKLGLPVRSEPAFSEDSYRDHPAGAADRLLQLLSEPAPVHPVDTGPAGPDVDVGRLPTGSIVVGSQGGVIPGTIKTLAGRSGLDVAQHGTPKGSFWVLSFSGSALVQADHHPAPIL